MAYRIFLAVAAGGAIGASARYLMMSQIGHWLGMAFPYGTLAVNALGSFALGALIEVMALVWSPSQALRAFLVVGVLGAFTTFSTFSLDVIYLVERHQVGLAGTYVLASVALSVVGLFVGLHVARAALL